MIIFLINMLKIFNKSFHKRLIILEQQVFVVFSEMLLTLPKKVKL